ncbi:MAG: GspE/PulE family protein [Candidatus Spechtbacterales bacterium]|nr:GspE/PulE family protein [Candidatus Spechtbacterales bacterium]
MKRASKVKNYPPLPKEAKENTEYLASMPRDLVKELQAFVFDMDGNTAKIAAVDPSNSGLKKYIADNFNEVHLYKAEKKDIEYMLKKHPADFVDEIEKILTRDENPTNGNLAEIVDMIISYSFIRRASDIHIEPRRNDIAVRFRVDGTLREVLTLPKSMLQSLVARFKIMANLKIDEHRRPQDGRLEPEEFPETSLRISIVPTLFGEKIALRILNDTSKSMSLQELGFSEEERDILVENIRKPHGLIVTSGPTGSGKTTTLYSILQQMEKDDLNVSTLEDPIEYTLPGVNQIQINPRIDLTFASGLRSLLRQDPDIMMVGEIRDSETAFMAANAAMTGHLVLTTIHTNDAASVFSRFMEMKVEDFVVASTVNLVIAQRLVRRICRNCSTKTKLDPVVLDKIKERSDILEVLNKNHGFSAKALKEKKFSHGKGCDVCLSSGYEGRVGIFEFIVPNKKIRDLILSQGSTDDVRAAADELGFRTMLTDGIAKVIEGETTFEEVMRTTKPIN